MRLRTFFAGTLAAGLLFAPAAWAAFGDEALEAAFPSDDLRDSHESMVGQKKTLAAIQSAFLAGDEEAVQSEVNALNRSMRAISNTIPATATEYGDKWEMLYKVVTESQAMKASADAGDFSGAYDHYTTLTGLCIKCHTGIMNVPAEAPEAVTNIEAMDITPESTTQAEEETEES